MYYHGHSSEDLCLVSEVLQIQGLTAVEYYVTLSKEPILTTCGRENYVVKDESETSSSDD